MTVLREHDGSVAALATDGTWLASTGEDGDVVLVSLATGEEQVLLTSGLDSWDHPHRLQWHEGVLRWASLSGCTGTLTPGQVPVELEHGEGGWDDVLQETLCDLAVAPDGTIVVAGGDGEGIIVVDAPSGERKEGKTAKWPYTVAISRSAASLLVGTWDGRVHVSALLGPEALEAQELPVEQLMPCFDSVWLDDATVVVVGCGRGEAASVRALATSGEHLWAVTAGDALCVVRFGDGVAVGLASGEVLVLGRDGSERQRFAALEDAPGGEAPFPSNVEYFEVPPQAVCSLAAHGTQLFAGLAGGAVRRLQ